ncbi:MAG: carboxypeptidase regulatory-like domain-containing protein, partial [Rhodoferax sp.]|nr:carboxypeptidase regulatory-like domain-containing protein [Rhodoferax sp.]
MSLLFPRLGGVALLLGFLVNAALAVAAVPPPGTIVPNIATSTQQVGAALQSTSTNTVQVTVGAPSLAQPTLTKSFASASISLGGNTPLNFRLTNSAGNPAQTGITFIDTLPAGLRLIAGATSAVSGAGCTATVLLTAPSTISVTSANMTAGTATCDIAVNGITNAAGANPDCSLNPAGFTNGQSAISGLTNVSNGVTNQCLVVTPMLNAVANGVCLQHTPYVDYAVAPIGVGAPAGVKIEWQKISGEIVQTLTNLPLSGRVLWPGATVDGTGNPTNWPGWVRIGDFFYPVNDGLRPDMRMIFTVNSTITVVVNYPAATAGCNPNPPTGPPAKPNLDVTLVKWLSQNYGLSPSGPYGVTIRYANASHIDAGKNGVQVSDTLPAGMLFVPGSLRVRPVPGGPAFALSGASGTTMINGASATYTTSANSVAIVFSRLSPAEEGFLEFDVNIAPGFPVDAIIQNTAQVSWLDAMGVSVGPRISNTVDFRVTGTEGVTLTGMTLPRVDPGSTVIFENILTNRSGRTDTFDITLTASNYPQGTRFKLYKPDGLTLLPDTNGNGIADTGPVGSGATYRIIVKAELPNGSAGGPYTIAKNAQSISNPLVRASDNDVVGTISTLCRVVLEPNNNGRVAPGGSITYSHVVTNIGNCTETITVPSGFLTNLVAGWGARAFVDNPAAGGQSIVGVLDAADAELTTLTTFTLVPGASAVLLNRVTAPAIASNGTSNTTTVRITASLTGALSATDTTTILIGSTGDIIDVIVGFIDPGFLRPTVWGFIGKPLYLRANAPSCNADPTVIERRTIIITGPNGEREEIIAIETGPDTGMFVAEPIAIRLPPVVASDRVLEGNPYDSFQVEIVGCGKKIATTITLIDPNGVVFDSRTNRPIAGATVRIVTASGGICTNIPATVRQLVTGQVTPAANSVVTGSDGRFNFDLVAAGDYCVLVTTPNGYTWTSRVAATQLPAGRNILATGPTSGGSYGGAFRVGPETGPVIVDIPVDGGLIGGLFIQKTVPRAVVEIGELLDYTVTVNNKTGYALDQSDVFLTDTLPLGFSYVTGTARRDGKSIADPQGGGGPRLLFNLGRMNRDQQVTVSYRIRVGPGAMQGDGINRAVASYRIGAGSTLPGAGSTLYSESNVATAKVEIVGGVFSDRAYIIGKVFADCNDDGVQMADGADGTKENGIPGVRVVLEDGTSAISDSEGKFSFYGLLAKTHVLKVDRTSLPEGIAVEDFALLSSRNLGKGDSRIVDLKKGELHKANFAIKVCREKVVAEINARRLAAISLKTEVDGRLQQKLETDPNLRATSDVRALPASGEVGNLAPTANIAAPQGLGATAAPLADSSETLSKSAGRFDTLAKPQSDVAQKRRESPAREPEIDLELLLPNEDNTLGFIGLKSGDVLPYAQTTIRVKGTAGATFKLKVNDKEVNADRVGKKAVFAEKSSQAWEFFGVDLVVGENTLSVAQLDEFGNVRGEKAIKVVAPGPLPNVKISFVESKSRDGAIADGKTPTRVVVSLSDRNNVPVTSRVAINLSATAGRWDVEDLNPAEPGLQTFVEGGRAEFSLLPPSDPGQAQIKVSSGDIKAEAKLDFLPDLRDLIAVGVIEGVLNLRKLDARGLTPARAQDGFEQEISHLSRTWGNGERDAAARAAVFLKGKVLGEYLLTMAYDSDKNTRERLFRDIQPDEFYPVYGDSSVRAFDAQSTGRFYVRIDNKKSYLLYGDFNTSQATDARKLSNYSRSLTGVKQHFENAKVSANIFASRDSTRQII